jgi:hypothetical protein
MAQQEKAWDTNYEWKIIFLLSLTFGLVGLDRFVLPIILQSPNSTMAKDLGLTPQDGGTLAGYLGMAWGISAFVMGYLADKVGRRAVLVPAILVFSLMSAFSGLAGSVTALVLVHLEGGVEDHQHSRRVTQVSGQRARSQLVVDRDRGKGGGKAMARRIGEIDHKVVLVQPEVVIRISSQLMGRNETGVHRHRAPDLPRQERLHIAGRFRQLLIKTVLLPLQLVGQLLETFVGLMESNAGAHAGQQLIGVDRLAEEIIRTAIQPCHAILHPGA